LSLSAEALSHARAALAAIEDSVRLARAAGKSPDPHGAAHASLTSREAEEVTAKGERELRRVADQVARLSARRQILLYELRAAGFPTGRWVEERGRGFFLEEVAADGPAGERLLELHEGPWDGVEKAPPMEPPAETLRRAALLKAGRKGYAELALLWALVALAVLAYYLTGPWLPLPHLALALALAALWAAHRLGLLDALITGDPARERARPTHPPRGGPPVPPGG
jgi:hypothetical protein